MDQEKVFILSVIPEDVPFNLLEDLKGHISQVVGELLHLDDGVGYSVEEA